MSRWKSIRYPEFTQAELQQMNALLGKELESSGATPESLMAEKGLSPSWTNIVQGDVPEYVYPQYRDMSGSDARTLSRDSHYPLPMANESLIVVAPGGTKAENLSEISHELEHVKEKNSLPRGVAWNPDAESNSNKAQHFMSDEPGQMFNYEARDALNRLMERLMKANK